MSAPSLVHAVPRLLRRLPADVASGHFEVARWADGGG
jgi:hypothetical protein